MPNDVGWPIGVDHVISHNNQGTTRWSDLRGVRIFQLRGQPGCEPRRTRRRDVRGLWGCVLMELALKIDLTLEPEQLKLIVDAIEALWERDDKRIRKIHDRIRELEREG